MDLKNKSFVLIYCNIWKYLFYGAGWACVDAYEVGRGWQR